MITSAILLLLLLLTSVFALEFTLFNHSLEGGNDGSQRGKLESDLIHKLEANKRKLWIVVGEPVGRVQIDSKHSYWVDTDAPPHTTKFRVHPEQKYDKGKLQEECNTVTARTFSVLTPEHATNITWCREPYCHWECIDSYHIEHVIAKDPNFLWLDLNEPKMKNTALDFILHEAGDQAGARMDVLVDPASPLRSFRGEGQIASVVDSGLDTSHRMFFSGSGTFPISRYSTSTSSSHPKVDSYFYQVENGITVSDNSHGTAVSSCTLGYNNNMGVSGVATLSKVAFHDVGGSDGYLYVTTSNIISILNSAYSRGARVFIYSFGYCNSQGEYTAFNALVDGWAYTHQNTAHFAAAGNYNPYSQYPCSLPRIVTSPATAKNVISVGASFSEPAEYDDLYWVVRTDLMHPRSAAYFSAVGPAKDGRREPIFYAPGVSEYVAYGLNTPDPDHELMTRASGTSFAAPLLAGVGVLLRNWYESTQNSELQAPTIRAIMLCYVKSMVQTVNSYTGLPEANLQDQYGYGTPKIGNLTELTITNNHVLPYDHGTLGGGIWGFTVNRLSKIAISWYDPASSVGASRTLINDFDLFVFSLATRERLNVHDDINPQELFQTTSSPEDVWVVITGSKITERVAIVHDGMNVTEVSTSCLPGEVEDCTLENGAQGYRLCDLGFFSATCQLHTCPIGMGGLDCASSTLGIFCLFPEGEEGELSYEEVCVVKRCSKYNHIITADDTCSCIYAGERYFLNGSISETACKYPITSSLPSSNLTGEITSNGDHPQINNILLVVAVYIYLWSSL